VYSVTLRTDFIAQHFLIGGDWGPENERNSHHYVVEVQLEGRQLDQHGYLVDITHVDAELSAVRGGYADRLLNELPEFAGLNPSIEQFARIICERMVRAFGSTGLSAVAVRVWENERASAVYRQELSA
jgi:6-pyruvoyltetrahydropterin/6-carboxytetrahydropterin synthase